MKRIESDEDVSNVRVYLQLVISLREVFDDGLLRRRSSRTHTVGTVYNTYIIHIPSSSPTTTKSKYEILPHLKLQVHQIIIRTCLYYECFTSIDSFMPVGVKDIILG